MSFAGLAGPLNQTISALAPPHGQALDIGCGAGVTSIALAAQQPDLEVTGVDLSEALVAVARSRGGDLPNAAFRVGDITRVADDPAEVERFDFAFSRHGVMFFDDPVVGFRAIRRLLRDKASLVFSCFADMRFNPWAAELAGIIEGASGLPPPAGHVPEADRGGAKTDSSSGNAQEGASIVGMSYTPGPFGFADPEFVRMVLESAGFIPGEARLVNYAYRAGEGADAVGQALHFFQRIGPAARALAAVEPSARAEALERLRALLVSKACDGAVEFPATAWIWTARANGEAQ